ncbi:MAG: histidine phosphatase family protein [Dehalococcoidales bacterium]|nr:histidine phosphatase family protein [Dehalococcoidales bacterium]
MVEIILARHGETDWNTGEIFRGRADVGLNETGLRQAELLGDYLSGEKIDFIYSSPLKRAVQTAEAIAQPRAVDVNIVQSLIDFDYGEWQGLSHREVKEKYPELYQDWRDTPEQVRIPGGESLEEVRSRVMPFVEDAVMRCGEGKIVFVSHRVVNKVLICNLLGLGNAHFWNIRLDTGGITRFNCGDGRVVLASHNDTSYLKSVEGIPSSDF